MGVVDKASVHGVVPDDRVFAVNYPGYPSSLARATQTLGGEKRIAEARSSDSNYLELKFRPEDPCAHAAFGELQQTSDLLLRIKRKPRQNLLKSCVPGTTDTAPGSSSPGYEVSADIIARVENTYNFEGMADYQYVLAVHVDAAKCGQKRRNAEEHFEKGSLTDMEQEELMMLVPPLFSIKDIPEETVLRPSDFTNKKTKRKNLGDSTSQMEANALPCFALDFKTKEVPAPLLWEQELLKTSVEYQLTAATAQLFDERPIWAKATLNDRLTDLGVVLTDNHVRRLLFKTGYYFGYGPFRTLWIKRGYDPRKDPDSRKYQMLDYRIPQAVRETGGGPERQNAKESGPAWRDICCFKVAPQKKFSFLQLYDLQDDFIQELIQKPAEKTTCSEYTGWFRRGTLERIRQHIRVRFLGLMPNEAARELERAEAKSLQRYLSTTGAKKKSSWQDDDEAPEPELNVEESGLVHEGLEIQTPSELSFTPLPEILPQEDAVLETEKEVEMPEEDEETLEAEAAVNRPIEEEEEEEEEEFEDEEEDEEEEEIEDEEDEEDDIEGQQFKDGDPGGIETGEVPGGFLQELLQRFPLGSNQTLGFGLGGPAGAEEDDAEYAIYEQADEDDDDD